MSIIHRMGAVPTYFGQFQSCATSGKAIHQQQSDRLTISKLGQKIFRTSDTLCTLSAAAFCLWLPLVAKVDPLKGRPVLNYLLKATGLASVLNLTGRYFESYSQRQEDLKQLCTKIDQMMFEKYAGRQPQSNQ